MKGDGDGTTSLQRWPRSTAVASHAMVCSSHPAVTAAALAVLRDGGNAIDALLTAVPLQQVLEPQFSTIAGGFGLLYWDAERAEPIYLNAHPDHPHGMTLPGLDSPATSGSRIAVPGTVAGLHAVAQRFGTRPWGSYFAPAIAAARDGFPMYSTLYGEMAAAFARLVHFPSGRERYLPDGHLVPVGQLFCQPKLAAALSRIAQPDGVDWFQHGDFARHFVAATAATGGTMTLADMQSYEPRWQAPLPFSYNGHAFLGSPPPDSGGLYCGFALGVLERTALAQLGPWQTAPRALALIARVLADADGVATRYTADPLAFAVPVETVLSPEFLSASARLVDGSFPTSDLTLPIAETASTPPAALRDREHRPPSGSNQLVIVDAHGNWVSMLHTGYATDFGTGLVVDGIGVNAANVFPGITVGAGRRICPPVATVLGLRDGRPWLGLGSTGYPPPSVTLVLLNLLEYHQSLTEAIDAPRFRLMPLQSGPRPVWDIGQLAVETRLPPATMAGLRALGFAAMPLGDYGRTGCMQAIMADTAAQQLIGVTDPRRPGLAEGF